VCTTVSGQATITDRPSPSPTAVSEHAWPTRAISPLTYVVDVGHRGRVPSDRGTSTGPATEAWCWPRGSTWEVSLGWYEEFLDRAPVITASRDTNAVDVSASTSTPSSDLKADPSGDPAPVPRPLGNASRVGCPPRCTAGELLEDPARSTQRIMHIAGNATACHRCAFIWDT
jgi:hypothetical protein